MNWKIALGIVFLIILIILYFGKGSSPSTTPVQDNQGIYLR